MPTEHDIKLANAEASKQSKHRASFKERCLIATDAEDEPKLLAVVGEWADMIEQLSPFDDCSRHKSVLNLRRGFDWRVHMSKYFMLHNYVSVELGIAIPNLEYGDDVPKGDRHGILVTLQVNRNSVISYEGDIGVVADMTECLIDPKVLRRVVCEYLKSHAFVQNLVAENFEANYISPYTNLITTLEKNP